MTLIPSLAATFAPALVAGVKSAATSAVTSAAPLGAFSFPLLFSGLLGDVVDEPVAPPLKDRKVKEQPPVAVAEETPHSQVLPFLLNLQIPQPDAAKLESDLKTAEPKVDALALMSRRTNKANEQAADAIQSPIQLTGHAAELLSSPVISPSAPHVDSKPNPQPAATPMGPPPPLPMALPVSQTAPEALVRVHSDAGSPWKGSGTKLPGSELAFAARVLSADRTEQPRVSKGDSEPQAREAAEPIAQFKSQTAARGEEGNSQHEQSRQPVPHVVPRAAPRVAEHASERPAATSTEENSEVQPATVAGATAPVSAVRAAMETASTTQATQATKPLHHLPSAKEIHAPDPPAAPPSAPLRNISLRLSGSDQDKVEVNVVESAGQIRVAVHSSDPELTSSLQRGIGELAGNLEARGMRAETWRPAGESASTPAPSQAGGSQNQQQQFAGDGSQGRQRHPPQTPQPRRQNKPGWVSEIDGNFNALHSENLRRMA